MNYIIKANDDFVSEVKNPKEKIPYELRDTLTKLGSDEGSKDDEREEARLARAKQRKEKSDIGKTVPQDFPAKSWNHGAKAQPSIELAEALEKLQAANLALEKERDAKLEAETRRDEAVKEVEELRAREAGIQLSLADMDAATSNFDPILRIGQGAVGTVYRGSIGRTAVAIKTIDVESLPCGHELKEEVKAIYKMKHPHFVTFIGACSEPLLLVYEYMENGNLKDLLNGSPPIPWQTRIRIAAEICDALLFIHYGGYAYGNLKPSNILFDANLVTKLDLGFCAPIRSPDPKAWDPTGTLGYTDPEMRFADNFRQHSDIYSFGVVLLELLTGRPGILVPGDTQEEVDPTHLQGVLDQRAGNWPFIQALQLANLGLRCCSEDLDWRPDLETEIWKVLDNMRSITPSATVDYTPENSPVPPDYFMCPITQEIMNDPHLAADGYTYEKEELQGWLDGGHTTSPMTNLPLTHLNLTPNHALRSAILEWRNQN